MPSDRATVDYPILKGVRAEPSEDGLALLVDGVAGDQTMVRFALALPDVRELIGFLLGSLGRIDKTDEIAEAFRRVSAETEPVPLSSFGVGDVESSQEALVILGVGPTELVFSLPAAAFDSIGRAMLASCARAPAAGPQ